MTYQPQAINGAGIYCWIAGLLGKCSADAIQWLAPRDSLVAQAVPSLGTGAVWLSLIGLLTLAVNKLYEDRQKEREGRLLREHDQRLRDLYAELGIAKEELSSTRRDLTESRDRRHAESNRVNQLILDIQSMASDTAQDVQLNAAALRACLSRLHLDHPTPGPILEDDRRDA